MMNKEFLEALAATIEVRDEYNRAVKEQQGLSLAETKHFEAVMAADKTLLELLKKPQEPEVPQDLQQKIEFGGI